MGIHAFEADIIVDSFVQTVFIGSTLVELNIHNQIHDGLMNDHVYGWFSTVCSHIPVPAA